MRSLTQEEAELVSRSVGHAANAMRRHFVAHGHPGTTNEWRNCAALAVAEFLISMPDCILSRLDAFHGTSLHEVGEAAESAVPVPDFVRR